jgi:hypothetical protein
MGKTRDGDQSREERRECFRVNDVLSTVCRKLDPGAPHLGARILPGFTEDYTLPQDAEAPPEEGVNPHLWKMLLQIHSRLGLILQRMDLQQEGLSNAQPSEISLSTGGAMFTSQENYEVGDLLEVKILLPLDPPQWIVVYGEVVRGDQGGQEKAKVAVRFVDADEQVTAAIGRYCLKLQREIIRKRKDS